MKTTRILGALALLLSVAACGDDDAADGITIGDPWARASAMTQNAGAVYMQIDAGANGDTLLGVSVSSDIAAMAELHETVMVDDGSGTTMADGMGAMTMQAIESLAIPSNGTVSLEPGGYHIMLMDLVDPLVSGETFEVTLRFEDSGDQTIQVEVREG
jgi:copper(I)-binding protein